MRYILPQSSRRLEKEGIHSQHALRGQAMQVYALRHQKAVRQWQPRAPVAAAGHASTDCMPPTLRKAAHRKAAADKAPQALDVAEFESSVDDRSNADCAHETALMHEVTFDVDGINIKRFAGMPAKRCNYISRRMKENVEASNKCLAALTKLASSGNAVVALVEMKRACRHVQAMAALSVQARKAWANYSSLDPVHDLTGMSEHEFKARAAILDEFATACERTASAAAAATRVALQNLRGTAPDALVLPRAQVTDERLLSSALQSGQSFKRAPAANHAALALEGASRTRTSAAAQPTSDRRTASDEDRKQGAPAMSGQQLDGQVQQVKFEAQGIQATRFSLLLQRRCKRIKKGMQQSVESTNEALATAAALARRGQGDAACTVMHKAVEEIVAMSEHAQEADAAHARYSDRSNGNRLQTLSDSEYRERAQILARMAAACKATVTDAAAVAGAMLELIAKIEHDADSSGGFDVQVAAIGRELMQLQVGGNSTSEPSGGLMLPGDEVAGVSNADASDETPSSSIADLEAVNTEARRSFEARLIVIEEVVRHGKAAASQAVQAAKEGVPHRARALVDRAQTAAGHARYLAELELSGSAPGLGVPERQKIALQNVMQHLNAVVAPLQVIVDEAAEEVKVLLC